MPIDPRPLLGDIFAFVVAIVGMGCATGVIVTWIKWRARKTGPSPDVLSRLDELAERLNRLDNAVEAVAVEVERISEGQRFTTKLLAERAPAPALSERARAGEPTTSH